MGGLREDFSDATITNGFGVVTGTANALPLITGSLPVFMLRMKASPNNGGLVFVGEENSATWPLGGGDDTGWIPANNLGDFGYRGTGSILHFWYQA